MWESGILVGMRKPIYSRPLTAAEREALPAGLRSLDGFVLGRCQLLLASDRGEAVPPIARRVGCNEQTVRNVIPGFNRLGQAALPRHWRRPHISYRAVGTAAVDRLKAMLHQSPRGFGKPTRLWTLDLVAAGSVAEGLTPERVSGEPVRGTLQRVGIRWQRAKRWISSPDPGYRRKKNSATG